MATKRSDDYLGRQSVLHRYNVRAKYSRRLKSHLRPIIPAEQYLLDDTPQDQFITMIRPVQAQ